MPADLARLRVERFQLEVTYDATWTFSGLKGILGETWAHGPIFQTFAEAGTGQVNLTPLPDSDNRITAVAGVRASGLLAEGPVWTPQAAKIGLDWLRDVLELLKPQKTISVRNEIFGLFPIRNPETATSRLLAKYYQEAEFRHVVGHTERPTYTALDVFTPADGDAPAVSYVIGVVGPPHRGMFFSHQDAARDSAWWMGIRLNLLLTNQEGIPEPLTALESMIQAAQKEFRRLATITLPGLVQ